MSMYGVAAEPDVLSGTAAQNKSIFDRMVRILVAPAVNACVEAIERLKTGESGNLPTGGTKGQVLAKKSDEDYETEWVTQESGGAAGAGVPAGGAAGQMLVKKSSADYDTEWKNVPEGGAAGEEVLATHIDVANWASGGFSVAMSDGTVHNGTVTLDSNNRPASVTLNGHTLTLTLPEVE